MQSVEAGRGPRDLWCDFGDVAFLNFAGHSAMPKAAVAAVEAAAAAKSKPHSGDGTAFFETSERVRSSLAKLLGASAQDIALTTGASAGAAFVALGLPWNEGDEVLTVQGEFPSHITTWKPMSARKGIRFRRATFRGPFVTSDDILAALTPATRLVSVSHVRFDDGSLLDAEHLCAACHKKGVRVLLDVSQSCGAVPIDAHALGADFMVGIGYKYLLGPWGVGFLWISPSQMAELRPMPWNWTSQDAMSLADVDYNDPQPALGAKRWDAAEMVGPFNFNLVAFAASLDVVLAIGPQRVLEHGRGLIERLYAGLPEPCRIASPRDASKRGVFGCFAAESVGATTDLYNQLRQERIVVSLREGRIRVAPHLLNAESDIDRLLHVIRRWVERPSTASVEIRGT